ncbi:toxin-antitoxin system HicB family antitoxin [candidate division KSB1 bacterium]|nr:toxin-antitoxin system HicB family antitoxin [candidate division KSB1 bacterium]
MRKTQVVTLRMPIDLKKRLETEAKYQGVSVNQFANYLLNTTLTQFETLSALESRLVQKSVPKLKMKVRNILDKTPSRKVPNWDSIGE